MPAPRADGAPQADLAHALVHRDQHDVHDAYAADAQGQRPDEQQQDLQADGDPVDHGPELVASGHLDGALVAGREALPLADDLAHLVHGFRLQARRDSREDQHAGIARVPGVAGGAVGDPAGIVVAGEVVAELDLGVHDANDREAYAADEHGLADRRPSAE